MASVIVMPRARPASGPRSPRPPWPGDRAVPLKPDLVPLVLDLLDAALRLLEADPDRDASVGLGLRHRSALPIVADRGEDVRDPASHCGTHLVVGEVPVPVHAQRLLVPRPEHLDQRDDRVDLRRVPPRRVRRAHERGHREHDRQDRDRGPPLDVGQQVPARVEREEGERRRDDRDHRGAERALGERVDPGRPPGQPDEGQGDDPVHDREGDEEERQEVHHALLCRSGRPSSPAIARYALRASRARSSRNSASS
jgi:hypothetical protein